MLFRIPKCTSIAASNPNRGFVLPVVLGVGVITMLLGVMVIERSSQNRIAAIAQKANARSVAAAEHGITQLQALLNRYPPLATACSDESLSSTCNSTASWKTIRNTALEPCSADENPPISWLQSYADQVWKNSTSDGADGQFRLVSYEFQPNTTPTNAAIGTGILVVEGRIDPDDTLRTATTQLKVSFNVTRNPGLNIPPGLWIQDNQDSGVSSAVTLLTDVRDSTCLGGDRAAAQQLKGKIQSPQVFQPTPGLAFPELPLDSTALASTTGTANLNSHQGHSHRTHSHRGNSNGGNSNQTNSNLIDAIEDSNPTLPSSTQPQSGNVLTYRIEANQNGLSINLTDPSNVLEIPGTGADTIVLDLEGGLTLKDGGRIRIASNVTLVIYARGPVTLEGKETKPAIEQAGTPSASRAQVYVYPPPPPATPSDPPAAPYAVNLKGNEPPLYLALFAPTSKVTSSAKVQGNIWAKSWEGTDAAAIAQAPLSPSDLKLLWPPHISPVTVWQENP